MRADATKRSLIRSREAAAMLDVSVVTLRRAVHDGRVPVVRLRERGSLLFNRNEINAIISGRAR